MKTNDPSFENGFRPAEPRDAAAILIVSDGEVLWARRNPAIKFLGGFHAFPGGKTDSNDHCIEVKNCIDSELSANIACAVREVFEEVGVLLTRGGDKLTKGQRASLRDYLISGHSSFAEILVQWGLWIDAYDFIYTGFWTTPQFSPVRFKTRFFIAQHPRKQVPYAAISELEKIEYIAPEAALERCDVLQDQIFYMRRCGIDAYALRADNDIDKALAGLRVFSETYQAAADQPQPLFRRRIAREAA